MTKLKISRAAAAVTSGLVLSLGVVGMASANHGSDWDQGADNSVVSRVENDNDVRIKNDNEQKSSTGEAEVEENGAGGSAVSGNASNGNTSNLGVTVSNPDEAVPELPAPVLGDIDNTTSVKTVVNNDNDVKIKNESYQKATSGDASVEENGTGGNATSGNATNTNATTVTVSVTN